MEYPVCDALTLRQKLRYFWVHIDQKTLIWGWTSADPSSGANTIVHRTASGGTDTWGTFTNDNQVELKLATEQDRPHIVRRREAWFEGQLDRDPERLVFMADPCGWCRIFLAHVLRCDGFNALAGLAHFMILMDTTGANAIVGDEEQRQLRRLLKVEDFPKTPAVSVKAGTLTKIAKMAGEASEASSPRCAQIGISR
ncbi:hypothetical protein V5F48_18710 [Xanthobacter autotrophicus ATCC 700552]